MLFTKEMRDKINNELSIVSEQEPPALSNRQFAFAVTALSNEYKIVPHGGTIALAIAAKYFIEDTFKKGIQTEKEAFDLFTKEIEIVFEATEGNPLAFLDQFLTHLYLVDGYINLNKVNISEKIQRIAELYFDWYVNEARKVGLVK